MKLAPAHTYNFTEKRLKRESPRDFVSNFMNPQYTDLITKLSAELHMTTEDATAYALAFFNSMQDLFYFHHNINLGNCFIETTRNNKPDVTPVKVRNKIYKLRELMREPYFTNRLTAVERSKQQLQNAQKDLSVYDKPAGAPTNPEKYEQKMAVKKVKKVQKRRKGENKRYRESVKKKNKAIAKQWDWYNQAKKDNL